MAKPVWAATAAGSWATAGNWDTASVPVNGDEVLFRSNTFAVDSGLDQSAVTVDELEIESSYTGTIGTAAAELQIGATLLNIGRAPSTGSGSGSTRIKINLGSVQSLITILSTATTASETNFEPVRLRGTNASNALVMYAGTVGIATNDPDDVATLATVNLFGGYLNLGAGCTLTTINMDGQATILNVRSAFTTLNQNRGTSNHYGSGARTTISLKGGTANDYSSGTITTASVFSGATLNKWSAAATVTTLNLAGRLDLSQATGSITFTNTNVLDPNHEIFDPLNRAVFTNAPSLAAHVRKLNITRAGGGTVTVAA